MIVTSLNQSQILHLSHAGACVVLPDLTSKWAATQLPAIQTRSLHVLGEWNLTSRLYNALWSGSALRDISVIVWGGKNPERLRP